MKKRTVTPFSLAFLDIMFCGFGAVVLLVVILNGEVLKKREAKSEDLRGELSRATVSEQLAFERLTDIREKVDTARLEQGSLKSAIDEQASRRDTAERARADVLRKLNQVKQEQARLKAEQDALRNSTKLLQSRKPPKPKTGPRKIGFSGDGQRQYLTGLKLGGKRTLILVDRSSSMLDETIVNIVRRKLMEPAQKLWAPKWQRTLRSVNWLIANLQPGTQFQVYAFSTKAEPAIQGTDGRWLSSDSQSDLEGALNGVRNLVPSGGTSLHRAFRVPKLLNPLPDSIILITDGLPTQDFAASNKGPVSSDDRVDLFRSAVRTLPGSIPINTMLLPMEGDPLAAVSFWKLAINTKGSFLTPARDWP
ncbi:MAG: VWA domain-containing protein [Alphaproteobacteria bacterium]